MNVGEVIEFLECFPSEYRMTSLVDGFCVDILDVEVDLGLKRAVLISKEGQE